MEGARGDNSKGLRAARPLDVLFPVLALVLLWPIVSRYERPVQDRDFASFDGGSTDFVCNYLGSLAYIRGFDPYLNGRPEFRDPWRREIMMSGVPVSQYYLPGHFIALAPLAWLYQDDWEGASRAFFFLELIVLLLLAWTIASAALASAPPENNSRAGLTFRVFAITLILLGLHVGVRMGLERGQSDGIQAALFWGGVALAARGRTALAAFLFVAGTSMKGYGALLVLGYGVACFFSKKDFRAFLLGSFAAAIPILAFTWPFVLTGIKVALYKSDDFSYHWTIHGFKHVGWALSPRIADAVRYALTLFGATVAISCWWRFQRAGALGENSSPRLVIASIASLATMVGFSASSHAYNLILILPGLVWLAWVVAGLQFDEARRFESLFALAFLLIALRTPLRVFAPAAYGLILLLIWCALSVRGGKEPKPLEEFPASSAPPSD